MLDTIQNHKKIVITGIGLALIFAIFLLFSTDSRKKPPEYGPFANFAQCLTDKGVKVYGAFWCPTCNTQKNQFGRSWSKVNYIECSNPETGNRSINATCLNANISSYPTWEFPDGTREVIDSLTFEHLSQKSGCPLPADMISSHDR